MKKLVLLAWFLCSSTAFAEPPVGPNSARTPSWVVWNTTNGNAYAFCPAYAIVISSNDVQGVLGRVTNSGIPVALWVTNGVAWCPPGGGGGGGSQTPWLSDIDAAGFSLTNIANLLITNQLLLSVTNGYAQLYLNGNNMPQLDLVDSTGGNGAGFSVSGQSTFSDVANFFNGVQILTPGLTHITGDLLFEFGNFRVESASPYFDGRGIFILGLDVRGDGLFKGLTNFFQGTVDLESELRTTNNAGSAGQVLTSGGASTNPFWSAITFPSYALTNYHVVSGANVTVSTNVVGTNVTWTLSAASAPAYSISNYQVAAGANVSVVTNVSGTNTLFTVSTPSPPSYLVTNYQVSAGANITVTTNINGTNVLFNVASAASVYAVTNYQIIAGNSGLTLTTNTVGTNTAWTLAVNQGRSILLCSSFTPSSAGADAVEIAVPYGFDGITALTWRVTRLVFRVNTPGGAPSIRVEKSSGTGVFSPTTVGTVSISTGFYENSVTSALGTVVSGDKLRFNVLALASALNWTIVVEVANP